MKNHKKFYDEVVSQLVTDPLKCIRKKVINPIHHKNNKSLPGDISGHIYMEISLKVYRRVMSEIYNQIKIYINDNNNDTKK